MGSTINTNRVSGPGVRPVEINPQGANGSVDRFVAGDKRPDAALRDVTNGGGKPGNSSAALDDGPSFVATDHDHASSLVSGPFGKELANIFATHGQISSTAPADFENEVGYTAAA